MTNKQLNLEALESLSPAEKAYAMRILQELSENGQSKLYEDLLTSDYKEVPVDIETFITDDNYLGKAWKDASGKLKMYPFWMEQLKKLFPNNLDTNYSTLLESGARGIGKAQPLDSLVLSDVGYKRMGDIHIGDKVFGDDGELHNVIGVFPQGKKPVYQVTFSDKSSTFCCDEHLWTVYKINAHYRKQTLTLRQIMEDSLTSNKDHTGKFGYKYKIPITSPINFPKQDLFIQPYVLGCLLGDGSLTGDCVRFTSTDSQIVENINTYVQQNGYVLNSHKRENSFGLKRITHKNIRNQYEQEIENLGLKQTSKDKHVPIKYLQSSVQDRIDLLQGLMDTDGYCSKDGYCIFTTVSEQLKNDVVFLVQSLGGTAPSRCSSKKSYINKFGERVYGQPAYEVSVNLPDNICPFRLDRKKNRLNPSKHPPSRTIRSIDYISEQECQCILLDSKSHLYLTNDFIVTHNSEIACGAVGAYLLYRVMCLKNPLEFYHLKLTEKICFAFMNIKKELSEEIAVSKFQKTIQMSPWFMARGKMTQKYNQAYWIPPEPIKLIIGSQSDDVIGQPIYFAFFDEISFIRNQDIEKQKAKAKDMIDTAIGGMMTRFVYKGKNPTVLAIASSKRSEQSFMESYIKTLSQTQGHSTLVIDKPVWEVKPKGTYSDQTFYVGIGNKFLENLVIPDSDYDNLDIYREKGYKIIEVPIDFKAKFIEDIDRNLCDFAGISSSSMNKYMSAARVSEVVSQEFRNPFPDIITVGNGPDDTAQYYNYFDLSQVPRDLKAKPLYIHLDMSINGDMTGIAGVWIVGKKPSIDETSQSKDLSFRLAFSTSIKAPKGHQISFEKNRIFIRWLKSMGFNVKTISSDTYQSYDLQQQLKSEGFDCQIISVDKVNSDHICVPYQYFKSAIYEKRFSMYKTSELFSEIVDLEKNNNTGKVDHPANGRKDQCDAVCGAVYSASQHAEEFAYDFGEDLGDISSVNMGRNYNSDVRQATVDFETELNKIFGSNSIPPTSGQTGMDFGMGPATTNYQLQYYGDGIIVW